MIRIPDFQARGENESIDQYGSRALCFLLSFALTGLLDDEAIEQADRISTIAVSAKGMAPAALANLHAIRLRIARELMARQATKKAAFLAIATALEGDGIRPAGGAKVPARGPRPNVPPMDGASLAVPGRAVKRF